VTDSARQIHHGLLDDRLRPARLRSRVGACGL